MNVQVKRVSILDAARLGCLIHFTINLCLAVPGLFFVQTITGERGFGVIGLLIVLIGIGAALAGLGYGIIALLFNLWAAWTGGLNAEMYSLISTPTPTTPTNPTAPTANNPTMNLVRTINRNRP